MAHTTDCGAVILGHVFTDYESALIQCNLETLYKRRENRYLNFGLKTLLNPTYYDMFPVNPNVLETNYDIRNSEHFLVNKAYSESYLKSSIPYIQRMLKSYVRGQQNTSKSSKST